MTIKIKFPHDELCRRAVIVLNLHRRDIISVVPTEGGRKFFVDYWQGSRWNQQSKIATITIWQLIDAQPLTDVVGSIETVWSKGVETVLEILGLKKMPRSEKELKQAYRKAAFKAHPDSGGTEDAFRELQAAYESIMIMLPNLRRNL